MSSEAMDIINLKELHRAYRWSQTNPREGFSATMSCQIECSNLHRRVCACVRQGGRGRWSQCARLGRVRWHPMRVKRASWRRSPNSIPGGSASPADDVMSIGRRGRSPLAGRSALGTGTQRFEPRPPIPRALTPPPSAARLRGVRRCTAGGAVLAELNASSTRGGIAASAAARWRWLARSIWYSLRLHSTLRGRRSDLDTLPPPTRYSRRHLVQLRVDRARLCVWRHGSLAARSVRTLRAARVGMRRVQWPRRCVERARSREDAISAVWRRWSLRNRDLDMRAVCVRVVVGRWKWYPRPCVELVFAFSCRAGHGYGV